MQCEGVVLFMPTHVAWLTGGINIRGLISDTERPGIYTNGRQRWFVCSNIDTQRIFDEEIDRLGFQLKEWHWTGGRAALLGELVANKKVAADRPFPNMPLVNERLRTEIRPLARYDQERYLSLGKIVAHSVEATARMMTVGETEQEVAGQIAHRLYRHGVDIASVSVRGDGQVRKYGRSGFSTAPILQHCVLQVTGTRDGQYVTASRTVCFQTVPDPLRQDYDKACRLSTVYRSMTIPDESIGTAMEAGKWLLVDTPHEHEWRAYQPGYGTGWVPAEELRRMGHDEKFVRDQAVVWQVRVGGSTIIDTLLVSDPKPTTVTPTDEWPFKRITLHGQSFSVPDVLVRAE